MPTSVDASRNRVSFGQVDERTSIYQNTSTRVFAKSIRKARCVLSSLGSWNSEEVQGKKVVRFPGRVPVRVTVVLRAFFVKSNIIAPVSVQADKCTRDDIWTPIAIRPCRDRLVSRARRAVIVSVVGAPRYLSVSVYVLVYT